VRADGREQVLTATDSAEMAAGDLFIIETPGGGGYGAKRVVEGACADAGGPLHHAPPSRSGEE
jgi:N-methylhydantoinase B/oxoprolinase/acetone carboxylase alpha subunit